MQVVSHRVVVRILLLLTMIAVAGEMLGQQKSPAPNAKTWEAAQKAAKEIYGPRFAQAKTAAQKSALAKDMLDMAAKLPDGSTDQYALLRIARDIAAGAGEAPTALKAAEQLAGRFDVPAAKLKAETLLTAARQASLSGQQKAVAEAASNVLEELATADEYETALALCEAARGCARSAKQSQLAKDLIARAGELKKRAAAFQEYLAAVTVLETRPTDAEANLAAGRYLCLVTRDWDRGVAVLALGNDPGLKAAATKELQGGKSAEEQVAVGDAWWSLADSQAGREKESLRLRAGAWYKQAKPQLAAGLTEVKVTTRLEEVSKLGVNLPKPSPIASPAAAPPLAIAPFDEQTAKRHQAAWAKYLKVPVVQTNSIGMRLVLLPAGKFMMGASDEEKPVESGARPQHEVRINKPFYLGVYEVTQAEYEQVMGSNPSFFRASGGGASRVSGLDTGRFPVETISWDEAMAFCRCLSDLAAEKAAGRVYRLPTEAEWEYACRAGTTTPFDFGVRLNGREANCNGSNPYGTTEEGTFLGRTERVGAYSANAFGLYDVHGNVWEWCADWLGSYAVGPASDPAGPGSAANRVFRGGCWYDAGGDCRSAHRYGFNQGFRHQNGGFRVVRTLTL